MKFVLLVVVCCFALSVYGETKDREKRFLDICSTDEDCGHNRCCIRYLHICAPKRGIEQSCNFKNYHGCGCESGLFCQVAKCFGTYKYYRCLPPA